MKMKNALVPCLLLSITTVAMMGCGTKKEDDDKRPSLTVSTFNGGYGREWLDNIVNSYNALKNSDGTLKNKYKIVVRATKDEFSTVKSAIMGGTADYDMFYSNGGVYSLIDGNYLEPIDDVWNGKPDGTRTLKEMTFGAEDYEQAYSGTPGTPQEGHIYAVPQQESVRTFVYDHELFLENELLIKSEDADGRITGWASTEDELSVGKDGIKGTYDDGHPVTEKAWATMCEKIFNTLGALSLSTKTFAMYANTIANMVAAQYEGVDTFKKNWTLQGSYDFGNTYEGEDPELQGVQPFTKVEEFDQFYITRKFRGFKKGIKFLDDYVAYKKEKGTKQYAHKDSNVAGLGTIDAQNTFLLNTAITKKDQVGFLVEGDWWENEAKTTFDSIENKLHNGKYAFRKHDYRFMTLPYFEGQYVESNGSKVNVYDIAENMYMALIKNRVAGDEEKKAACKDFMLYSYKEQFIRDYTVLSGGITPFDVQLSEEEKAKLSPFTKHFLELYQDRVHNKFVNTMLYSNQYLTSRGGLTSLFSTKIGNEGYYMITQGLYNHTADEYFNGMYTNTKAQKESMLEAYRNYIAH